MSYTSKAVLYAAIRLDLHAGLSKRAVKRKYAVGWLTVAKAESAPLESRRKQLPRRHRLDIYKPFIDNVLRADMELPHSQRRTALWIYHRLLVEHGMQDISYQLLDSYVRDRNPHLMMERIATYDYPTG